MPQIYQWVAETRKGRKLKGEIEAASEQIAQSQLKKRNLKILKLNEKLIPTKYIPGTLNPKSINLKKELNIPSQKIENKT